MGGQAHYRSSGRWCPRLEHRPGPGSSDFQGIPPPQRDKPRQTTLATGLLPCPPGARGWEEGENAGAGGLSGP